MQKFTAVYPLTYIEAVRNGDEDLKLYTASYKENTACARSIENAVSEYMTGGTALRDGAAKSVIDNYGIDRVTYVLANTVKYAEPKNMPPYSKYSMEFADCFDVAEDNILDRRVNDSFTVSSYSGLIDLFIEQTAEQRALTLHDVSDCIQGDIDFTGQTAVLKPEVLDYEYQKPEYQLFYCKGGFGCSPTARGRKIFGEFLADGEATHFNREDFIGILKPALLPSWTRDKMSHIEKPSIKQQLADASKREQKIDKPKEKQADKGAR